MFGIKTENKKKIEGYDRIAGHLYTQLALVSIRLSRLGEIERDPSSEEGRKITGRITELAERQSRCKEYLALLEGTLIIHGRDPNKRNRGMFRKKKGQK